MLKKKSAQERGEISQEGLLTKSTFSFENYYDPKYLGVQKLKVLNENHLKSGFGFQAFHKDLVIFLFILKGTLEYEDEKGNRFTFLEGDGSILHSGSGLSYYLKNISPFDAHFYQFWFLPENYPLAPNVEKRAFPPTLRWGKWTLLGSLTGRDGSLALQQDSDIYTITLNAKEEVAFEGLADRFYWIQIAEGSFSILDHLLESGDGLYLSHTDIFTIICQKDGSLFLLDLS